MRVVAETAVRVESVCACEYIPASCMLEKTVAFK